MKSKFAEFYPYLSDELKELVSTASVVIDTNVLLHVYRYSPDAADRLISILQGLSGRLWMPHQVALEFHTNRAKVIFEQAKAYDDILRSLAEIKKQVDQALGGRDLHPFIKKRDLADAIVIPIESESNRLKELRESHSKSASSASDFDKHWQEISRLFEDHVGEPFDEDVLLARHKDADARYSKGVPPGYKDEPAKSGDEKYGDALLWFQILDHFESEPNDLIFVTDDQKEDWWLRVSGRTMGAHPSLRREFSNRTGKRVHFYTSEEFITHFAKSLSIDIDTETRAEVERVSNAGNVGDDSFLNWKLRQTAVKNLPAWASDSGAVDARSNHVPNMETMEVERLLQVLDTLREEVRWLRIQIADSPAESLRRRDFELTLSATQAEIETHKFRLVRVLSDSFSIGDGSFSRDIPPALIVRATDSVMKDV